VAFWLFVLKLARTTSNFLKTVTEESKQPLVSVIMPCYKMGRFIGEALESVGKQTFTNWEVLAVDDCGPGDGTKEAVEAFAKQFPNHRVIYHWHEKNGGVSAARNTAIELAQGEYLAFLDPDDWWASEYLNEQVRILLSEKGTFCFCSNILVDEKGKEISIRTPTEFFLDNLPASLVYQNYLNPSAVLMRRLECLKVGMFDESSEIQHMEDWDLWLRCFLNKIKISYNPKPLVYYRQHTSSACADGIAFRKRMLSLLEKTNHKEEILWQRAMLAWRLDSEFELLKQKYQVLEERYDHTLEGIFRRLFRKIRISIRFQK
jgi:glycosyltransferase involved in cell wall biosynthesis